MNLGAPRARMLIGPEGPCRWRSNGHLRRCQSALHLAIPEQAPTPTYSDTLLTSPYSLTGPNAAMASPGRAAEWPPSQAARDTAPGHRAADRHRAPSRPSLETHSTELTPL